MVSYLNGEYQPILVGYLNGNLNSRQFVCNSDGVRGTGHLVCFSDVFYVGSPWGVNLLTTFSGLYQL